MSNPLSAHVEDIATALLTYDEVNWHRHTVPTLADDETFGSEIATEDLVSGQRLYEDTDATGDAGHWYRWRLHNDVGSLNGPWSPPFRGTSVSLLTVIQEAARKSGLGWTGTLTANAEGDTRLFDAAIGDASQDVDFTEGGWVHLPEADAVDQLRRAVEFYPNSGGIRVSRAWETAPVEDDPYGVYMMLAPFETRAAGYTWADAARDGIRCQRFPDQLDIGAVNSDHLNPRYDLSAYRNIIRTPQDIRRVLIRQTVDSRVNDWDANKLGGWTEFGINGQDGLHLDVFRAPSGDEYSIVIEVDRAWSVPYGQYDLTDCPLELAARATIWRAYSHMNGLRQGKYAIELAHAFQNFKEEASNYRVWTVGVTGGI